MSLLPLPLAPPRPVCTGCLSVCLSVCLPARLSLDLSALQKTRHDTTTPRLPFLPSKTYGFPVANPKSVVSNAKVMDSVEKTYP